MSNDDIQATIDRISQILSAPAIAKATARLLAPALQGQLSEALQRMRRKVAYVAAIGSQGSGKSSLLNSLLFTRRVLPIGEGITTNVVCFVQDAGDTPERCEILLTNGSLQNGPLDVEYLRQFMDEAENPDNKKKVASIHCFAHSTFLGENTSYVDTPGLGSTRKWHDDTTHDDTTLGFVRDISLGVYVLRTTPTLTGSEGIFLRDIWPLCPGYVFVQNVWGESQAEIEASLHDNAQKLAEIAAAFGDQRPISIVPVDIHEGLEGATNCRPDLVENSGLGRLKRVTAARVSRNGQRLEITGQGSKIIACLRLAIQAGHADLTMLQLRGKLSGERLADALEQAQRKVEDLRAKSLDQERNFLQKDRQYLANFKEQLSEGIDKLRGEFKDRVGSRQGDAEVGHDYLDALKRVVSTSVREFQLSINEIRAAYAREMAISIAGVEQAFRVQIGDAVGSVEDVSGSRVTEWLGNVTAGAGGTALTALTVTSVGALATTLTAGGTVGAGLAAAFAAVPGIGWGIAAGILAAGLVVRFVARENRKDKLLQELGRIAMEVKNNTFSSVSEEAGKSRNTLATEFAAQFRAVVAQQQKQASDMQAKLALNEQNQVEETSLLRTMVADLENSIVEIEGLLRVEQA